LKLIKNLSNKIKMEALILNNNQQKIKQQRERRKNESEEQRAIRLLQCKIRYHERLASETDEQRSLRLEAARERLRIQRETETDEQREMRKIKLKEKQQQKRAERADKNRNLQSEEDEELSDIEEPLVFGDIIEPEVETVAEPESDKKQKRKRKSKVFIRLPTRKSLQISPKSSDDEKAKRRSQQVRATKMDESKDLNENEITQKDAEVITIDSDSD
jgi:hypothetical protein